MIESVTFENKIGSYQNTFDRKLNLNAQTQIRRLHVMNRGISRAPPYWDYKESSQTKR